MICVHCELNLGIYSSRPNSVSKKERMVTSILYKMSSYKSTVLCTFGNISGRFAEPWASLLTYQPSTQLNPLMFKHLDFVPKAFVPLPRSFGDCLLQCSDDSFNAFDLVITHIMNQLKKTNKRGHSKYSWSRIWQECLFLFAAWVHVHIPTIHVKC
jgi:hypothetical protein